MNDFLIKTAVKEQIFKVINKIDETIYQYNETSILDVNDVLSLIDDIGMLADTINKTENNPMQANLEDLNDKLKLLLQSLQDNDSELFVDILIYELKPLLTFWNQNCKENNIRGEN